MLLHSIKTQTEYFSCLSFAGNFLFWSCLCGKSPLHKVCYTLQQAGISPQQLLVSGGGGRGERMGERWDQDVTGCVAAVERNLTNLIQCIQFYIELHIFLIFYCMIHT